MRGYHCKAEITKNHNINNMVIGGFSAACAQRIWYGGIWLETKLWGVAADKEKTFDSVVSYIMSCLI